MSQPMTKGHLRRTMLRVLALHGGEVPQPEGGSQIIRQFAIRQMAPKFRLDLLLRFRKFQCLLLHLRIMATRLNLVFFRAMRPWMDFTADKVTSNGCRSACEKGRLSSHGDTCSSLGMIVLLGLKKKWKC